MNLTEQAADSLPVSIGLDPAVLLAFKSHCSLPTDSDWTESDELLQKYLTGAERQVDILSGMPYRKRNFLHYVENLYQYSPGNRPAIQAEYVPLRPRSFWCIPYPMRPVDISTPPVITWTDSSGATGTFISGIDFRTIAPRSIAPLAVFPSSFAPPSVDSVPYPFVLSFTAGGSIPDEAIAQTCIFEYAAAYYRNPESAGKELSYVSQVFDANLTALCGSFL